MLVVPRLRPSLRRRRRRNVRPTKRVERLLSSRRRRYSRVVVPPSRARRRRNRDQRRGTRARTRGTVEQPAKFRRVAWKGPGIPPGIRRGEVRRGGEQRSVPSSRGRGRGRGLLPRVPRGGKRAVPSRVGRERVHRAARGRDAYPKVVGVVPEGVVEAVAKPGGVVPSRRRRRSLPSRRRPRARARPRAPSLGAGARKRRAGGPSARKRPASRKRPAPEAPRRRPSLPSPRRGLALGVTPAARRRLPPDDGAELHRALRSASIAPPRVPLPARLLLPGPGLLPPAAHERPPGPSLASVRVRARGAMMVVPLLLLMRRVGEVIDPRLAAPA